MTKEGRLVQTVAMIAALGSGFPGSIPRSAPYHLCQNCKRSKLVTSTTGARYCHRCGWFERKQRP